MLCEISNPSDPYTLRCDDFLVGAVATFLLGNSFYGLQSDDGDRTPVIFGWDEWLVERGITDFKVFVMENLAGVIAALESVRIGSREVREVEEIATQHMTPEAAIKFRDFIHDKERTSMNNIGLRAWKYAEHLRGHLPATEVPKDGCIVLVQP